MNKFLSDMLDCEFSHSLAYEPNLNDIPDITLLNTTPKKKVKTMENEKLNELYKKYNLTQNDTYKHKHYHIITRQGIDKIQAIEKINIAYDVIKCEQNFAVVKATAKVGSYIIQTFGSALYGEKIQKDGKWKDTGTTQSWYIMEIAEKRAMSRAVLKLTGFYELGVFSEDESEDFKQPTFTPNNDDKRTVKNNQVTELIGWANSKGYNIANIEQIYKLTATQRKTIITALKTK